MAYRLIVVKEFQSRETGHVTPEHLIIRYGFLGFGVLHIPGEIRDLVTIAGVKWAKNTSDHGNTVEIPDEIGRRLHSIIREYYRAVRELNKAEALGPFSTEKDSLVEEAGLKVNNIVGQLERF